MPPSGKAKGKGKLHCVLCQTVTDKCATECPYNVCHCCGEHGHWVRSCTSVVRDCCHKKGHYIKDCPEEGANYVELRRLPRSIKGPLTQYQRVARLR